MRRMLWISVGGDQGEACNVPQHASSWLDVDWFACKMNSLGMGIKDFAHSPGTVIWVCLFGVGTLLDRFKGSLGA